ncbi:MAG: lytic polysaccharide monooxygenase, partial [Ferrovibrionaceae bacterium]
MKSLVIALGLGALLVPAALSAHGTMELPISRVYACYKEGPENPKTAACKDAKAIGGTQPFYDWNEVNQGAANGQHQALVPDGTLCAGGRDKYRGFNQARADWTTTPIVPDAGGNFTFVFYATAPHAVKSFDLYVTRSGWNPASSLKWGDLEKFASVGNPVRDGQRYRMT